MNVSPEMKEMRDVGHYSYAKIAQKMGVAKSTIQEAFGARKNRKSYQGNIAISEPGKIGRSLSDFRKVYDKDLIIPEKIKAALKSLVSSWVYEKEFVTISGVSFSDLGNYRDLFEGYIVMIRAEKKRIWCGSQALAKQLREIA